MVPSPLYRLPEYQEYPPEYQEWYRVVQSPLYRPPEYQEHPPEYQEWYRVVQSRDLFLTDSRRNQSRSD